MAGKVENEKKYINKIQIIEKEKEGLLFELSREKEKEKEREKEDRRKRDEIERIKMEHDTLLNKARVGLFITIYCYIQPMYMWLYIKIYYILLLLSLYIRISTYILYFL